MRFRARLTCLPALLLALLSLSLPAAAQSRSDGMIAAWAAWVKSTSVPSSTIAVAQNGKIVATRGINAEASRPYDLASLSKAVTGACLAQLVREDRLTLDASLGLILGPKEAGRHARTPLSAFVTHSAGLWPDATQKMNTKVFATTTPHHAAISRAALARSPKGAGKTRYSNENYMVLGRVIEKVTGESYTRACSRRLGLRGLSISPRWGGMGAAGGWRGSAEAYTRFMVRHFGPGSAIGGRPAAWPHNSAGKGADYSMGMVYSPGPVFHHAGLVCSNRRTGAGGYGIIIKGKVAVTVLFTGCASERALQELGAALTKAALR